MRKGSISVQILRGKNYNPHNLERPLTLVAYLRSLTSYNALSLLYVCDLSQNNRISRIQALSVFSLACEQVNVGESRERATSAKSIGEAARRKCDFLGTSSPDSFSPDRFALCLALARVTQRWACLRAIYSKSFNTNRFSGRSSARRHPLEICLEKFELLASSG